MPGKSKRWAPWPKRKEAIEDCIQALKYIVRLVKRGKRTGHRLVETTDCYCHDEMTCCWCYAKDALKDLRYSR